MLLACRCRIYCCEYYTGIRRFLLLDCKARYIDNIGKSHSLYTTRGNWSNLNYKCHY